MDQAQIENEIRILQKLISKTNGNVSTTDYEIANIQQKIMAKRKRLGAHARIDNNQRMGGYKVSATNRRVIDRKLAVLRKRIRSVCHEYDRAVGNNRKIRGQIDDLRREATIFSGVFAKLGAELNEKKSEVAENQRLVEECYEARDNAQALMGDLKREFDEEKAAYMKEWFALGKKIDAGRETKDQGEPPMANRGGMSIAEEAEKKKELSKRHWQIGKEKSIVQSTREELRALQEESKFLVTETGCIDMNDLLAQFIEIEDRNFFKLEHLNKLTMELKLSKYEVSELQQELETYTGQRNKESSHRKNILGTLETMAAEAEKAYASLRAKNSASVEKLKLLIPRVHSLFHSIGCAEILKSQKFVSSPTGAGVSLNDFDSVESLNELNILQCMGIAELRANELMQLYGAHMHHFNRGTNHGHHHHHHHRAREEGKEMEPRSGRKLGGGNSLFPQVLNTHLDSHGHRHSGVGSHHDIHGHRHSHSGIGHHKGGGAQRHSGPNTFNVRLPSSHDPLLKEEEEDGHDGVDALIDHGEAANGHPRSHNRPLSRAELVANVHNTFGNAGRRKLSVQTQSLKSNVDGRSLSPGVNQVEN